jgi:hypothetical protein
MFISSLGQIELYENVFVVNRVVLRVRTDPMSVHRVQLIML